VIVLWGGRRGDVQVGSPYDLARSKAIRQAAVNRRTAERRLRQLLWAGRQVARCSEKQQRAVTKAARAYESARRREAERLATVMRDDRRRFDG